jgi:hypothetical protein
MSHRSTTYPCFLPDLGEFSGSWSHKTYPAAKIEKIPSTKHQIPNKLEFWFMNGIPIIFLNLQVPNTNSNGK